MTKPLDVEIKALRAIGRAMLDQRLDKATRARVLSWASARNDAESWGVAGASPERPTTHDSAGGVPSDSSTGGSVKPATLLRREVGDE